MTDVDGLHVVVTGASRGIGAAIAAAFAAGGADVVGTARNPATVIAGPRDAPGTITPVALDLGDAASASAAATTIGSVFHGSCDVLVNNAGVLGSRLPLAEIDLDDVERVLATNLLGTLRFTRAVLPLMARGGAIVNVTSAAAGRAHWGGYSISKAGIDAITTMLRDELAPRGIRCIGVNPGGIRTDMRADAYPEEDPDTLPAPASVVPTFLAIAAGADPGPLVEARTWPG